MAKNRELIQNPRPHAASAFDLLEAVPPFEGSPMVLSQGVVLELDRYEPGVVITTTLGTPDDINCEPPTPNTNVPDFDWNATGDQRVIHIQAVAGCKAIGYTLADMVERAEASMARSVSQELAAEILEQFTATSVGTGLSVNAAISLLLNRVRRDGFSDLTLWVPDVLAIHVLRRIDEIKALGIRIVVLNSEESVLYISPTPNIWVGEKQEISIPKLSANELWAIVQELALVQIPNSILYSATTTDAADL